ncbi:MAG TPA: DUF3014 domain-containing protein [Rhodanobacteraceae bacterium]|nr:DUF3014 domain-containing protein [Rhodanobacteraceae bacterium]
MKSKTSIVAWVVAVVVIALIIIGAWFMRHGAHPPATHPAPAATTATTASAPAIQHPIAMAASTPAPASSAPLPTLDQSDSSVTAALARLGGGASVGKLLAKGHIIQRIVATIDALPRRELGNNILPLNPPAGDVATATVDGQLTLAPSDFARYDPYMKWVRQADVSQLVAWYVHAYPLFQEAYRGLGYPHGYFNDRLVAVINHLLKAPEPRGPIALEKTDKGYVFADPSLEGLSVGQKMMVRVGPANEKLIKQKLRAIRAAVTGEHGPATSSSE